VGIALVLALTPHAGTAAEDRPNLIADLSQAWQQGRSKDVVVSADRFDEALRIAPNDYRVHKAHGNFLTANRRNQGALVAYCRAAELAPNAIEVHRAMWSLFDRLGAQDQAIRRLKEIVQLDPANALVHLRLAKKPSPTPTGWKNPWRVTAYGGTDHAPGENLAAGHTKTRR
jgi:Flp pilus assembly protein TadD